MCFIEVGTFTATLKEEVESGNASDNGTQKEENRFIQII